MNCFACCNFDLDPDEALVHAKAALKNVDSAFDAAPIPGLSTAVSILVKVIELVEVRLYFIDSILEMIL